MFEKNIFYFLFDLEKIGFCFENVCFWKFEICRPNRNTKNRHTTCTTNYDTILKNKIDTTLQSTHKTEQRDTHDEWLKKI